jgi:uncharacterized protein
MSRDDDDPVTNFSGNPHIGDVVLERLRTPSRRDVLRGGLGLGALSWIGGAGLLSGCGDNTENQGPDAGPTPDAAPPDGPVLGFTAVSKSLADKVVVPAGYTATVLYSLGDPIAAGVSAYANNGMDPAASFEQRSGDHHDGMHYFGFGGTSGYDGSSDNGLLVMNHENITQLFLHPNGRTVVGGVRTVADEVQREFFAHGVSVIEVKRAANGTWSYVQDSRFNRRIHALTVMEIAGPLRGTDMAKTKFSPDGTQTRGTVNNCANGFTPWGTYLTCEENWAGYFRRIATEDGPRDAKAKTSFNRYGISLDNPGTHLWATLTDDTADDQYRRWDSQPSGATAAADYRNAAFTYGWCVEIDPFTPDSVPRKRTGLGRFAREAAWPADPIPGKPIVYYSGDDSRGEYIYKYVSNVNWDPADAGATDRLAVGNKYLDNGKVYVARFNPDGTGNWIELSFGVNGIGASTLGYAFADQADVLANIRLAADHVQATRMDRPEWVGVDPKTKAVYVTLTNNNTAAVTGRGVTATDAANPRSYNDPRLGGAPQRGNPNGHIIRWKESSPEATSFGWDIYVFGANADANTDNVNISQLTADNDFSSPDGLWFSPKTGILWIQTDDGAFTDVTNCMLLASLPGSVGDGFSKAITNSDGTDTQTVTTHVGRLPGDTLRRFLVGPVDCEITGLAETPDGTALFVNIQHPGEGSANLATPISTWPSPVAGTRPRSSTLVITRDGGGVIGLESKT